MPMPSYEDMQTAIMWLQSNEGTGGESEACSRVAKWLEAKAQASYEATAARQAGVSVKMLRQRLAAGRVWRSLAA